MKSMWVRVLLALLLITYGCKSNDSKEVYSEHLDIKFPEELTLLFEEKRSSGAYSQDFEITSYYKLDRYQFSDIYFALNFCNEEDTTGCWEECENYIEYKFDSEKMQGSRRFNAVIVNNPGIKVLIINDLDY